MHWAAGLHMQTSEERNIKGFIRRKKEGPIRTERKRKKWPPNSWRPVVSGQFGQSITLLSKRGVKRMGGRKKGESTKNQRAICVCMCVFESVPVGQSDKYSTTVPLQSLQPIRFAAEAKTQQTTIGRAVIYQSSCSRQRKSQKD